MGIDTLDEMLGLIKTSMNEKTEEKKKESEVYIVIPTELSYWLETNYPDIFEEGVKSCMKPFDTDYLSENLFHK